MTTKKSSRKIGDESEVFVADILKNIGYIVEIHPRTFRSIFIKGKQVYISKDNDYHNNFDIKAERIDFMIYAQVKFENAKNNTSKAQTSIDKEYPYEFPYQRIQTWRVWKEWVKKEGERRHKEFRFIIEERRGFETIEKGKKIIRKGIWIKIKLDELIINKEVNE